MTSDCRPVQATNWSGRTSTSARRSARLAGPRRHHGERQAERRGGIAEGLHVARIRAERQQREAGAQRLEDVAAGRQHGRREVVAGARLEAVRADGAADAAFGLTGPHHRRAFVVRLEGVHLADRALRPRLPGLLEGGLVARRIVRSRNSRSASIDLAMKSRIVDANTGRRSAS